MFWVFKTNINQCKKEYVVYSLQILQWGMPINILITITGSVNLNADGCLNLSLKDGNYLFFKEKMCLKKWHKDSISRKKKSRHPSIKQF